MTKVKACGSRIWECENKKDNSLWDVKTCSLLGVQQLWGPHNNLGKNQQAALCLTQIVKNLHQTTKCQIPQHGAMWEL
jgi:hypothetical protein